MKDQKNVSVTRSEQATPEAVWEGRTVAPQVDVYENSDELLVVADMPGVNTADIQINLNRDQLVLEGRVMLPTDGRQVLSSEFEPVSYRRAFVVPKGIDGSRISADHNAGVLRVHLPKSDGLKPRSIPIKAG